MTLTDSIPDAAPALDGPEIGLEHVTAADAQRNPLVGEPDAFAALALSPSATGPA